MERSGGCIEAHSRHFSRGLVILLCAGAVVLGACSQEDPARPGAAGGAATGRGVTVAEARASKLGRALVVRGFVVVEGDRVRLCDALAESYPPQCGGAFLEVRGMDLPTIPGLEAERDVRWTPEARDVLGEVRGGTLIVTGRTGG